MLGSKMKSANLIDTVVIKLSDYQRIQTESKIKTIKEEDSEKIASNEQKQLKITMARVRK